jgi:hypothetical protein
MIISEVHIAASEKVLRKIRSTSLAFHRSRAISFGTFKTARFRDMRLECFGKLGSGIMIHDREQADEVFWFPTKRESSMGSLTPTMCLILGYL